MFLCFGRLTVDLIFRYFLLGFSILSVCPHSPGSAPQNRKVHHQHSKWNNIEHNRNEDIPLLTRNVSTSICIWVVTKRKEGNNIDYYDGSPNNNDGYFVDVSTDYTLVEARMKNCQQSEIYNKYNLISDDTLKASTVYLYLHLMEN